MNIELEDIKIPSYPSGSYNFIRRLLHENGLPEQSLSTTTKVIPQDHNRGKPAVAATDHSLVKLNIAIIGAGVGGLSNGIALKQAGHRITIYEQASRLSEVGAGIQIPPNSSRILHSWGLETALKRRSVKPTAIIWRRWEDGSIIGRAKLNPESEERFGDLFLHLSRTSGSSGILAVTEIVYQQLNCMQSTAISFESVPGSYLSVTRKL